MYVGRFDKSSRAYQAQVATPDKFFDLFVVVFCNHAWYNRGKTILPVVIHSIIEDQIADGTPREVQQVIEAVMR